MTPLNKLTALEREAARLEGERGQLISSVAQAKDKITETRLQVIQIDRDLAGDVAKELRETDAKIDEYVERKVTAEDQLKRIENSRPADRNGVPVFGAYRRRRHRAGGFDHADRAQYRQSNS